MAVRAIRGATRVDADQREHVLAETRRLVTDVLKLNDLVADDVISIVFSTTPDIRSVAPALAARQLGLHDVALLCVQEMTVEGSMPLVVRLLAHVESDRPRTGVRNVYRRGTETLRTEIPPAGEDPLR